jgi:hypothetical protein
MASTQDQTDDKTGQEHDPVIRSATAEIALYPFTHPLQSIPLTSTTHDPITLVHFASPQI